MTRTLGATARIKSVRCVDANWDNRLETPPRASNPSLRTGRHRSRSVFPGGGALTRFVPGARSFRDLGASNDALEWQDKMSSPTLPVRRPLIGPRKREFKEHVRKTKLSIGALALFVLLCLALLYHGTPARMVAPSHKSVNTFSTGRLAKQHGNMFGTGDGATEAGSTQGDSLEDGTVVDSTALPTFETTVEDIPGPDVKQGNTDPEGRPTGAAIAEVSTSPLEKQGPVAHGTPYPGSFDELPFDEETRGRLIVYMQGEPKSGTTWLEMILDDMMDLYVKSHCTDCKIKGEIGENTRSIMNGQVSVSGVSFRNLVWSRRYKHSLAIDPKQQLKGAKAEGWVPLRGPAPGEILAGPYRQCFQWNLQRFWPNEPCPQLRPPPPLANRRFLCIVRDPRALIVSGFHYFNHHGRKKLTDYVADHAGEGASRTITPGCARDACVVCATSPDLLTLCLPSRHHRQSRHEIPLVHPSGRPANRLGIAVS